MRLPELPNIYCFIDFEVCIFPPTGLILFGDGPVVIENILDTPTNIKVGNLTYSQGNLCHLLTERGLIPSIGDIFIFVEEESVGHLPTNEVCIIISNFYSIFNNILFLFFNFQHLASTLY